MITHEQKQSTPGVRTYLPIEDYGIIGDLHTVGSSVKMVPLIGTVLPPSMLPASLAHYSMPKRVDTSKSSPRRRLE